MIVQSEASRGLGLSAKLANRRDMSPRQSSWEAEQDISVGTVVYSPGAMQLLAPCRFIGIVVAPQRNNAACHTAGKRDARKVEAINNRSATRCPELGSALSRTDQRVAHPHLLLLRLYP